MRVYACVPVMGRGRHAVDAGVGGKLFGNQFSPSASLRQSLSFLWLSCGSRLAGLQASSESLERLTEAHLAKHEHSGDPILS